MSYVTSVINKEHNPMYERTNVVDYWLEEKFAIYILKKSGSHDHK